MYCPECDAELEDDEVRKAASKYTCPSCKETFDVPLRLRLTLEKRAHVTPRCCDAVQELQVVVIGYTTDDDTGELIGEPYWILLAADSVWTKWRHAHIPKYRHRKDGAFVTSTPEREPGKSTPPRPTHCPFCGKGLPKIVKRVPEVVTGKSSDGYYCDTCGERNIACECPYMSQAYEPEPDICEVCRTTPACHTLRRRWKPGVLAPPSEPVMVDVRACGPCRDILQTRKAQVLDEQGIDTASLLSRVGTIVRAARERAEKEKNK